MDILNQFGVQPVLLAAQVVNFFILLFILKKFLYGPILKVLEERRKRIEESLQNAENIEKKLAQTEQESEKILGKALTESQKIIEESKTAAAQILEDAKVGASEIIDKAQKIAQQSAQIEKEKIQQEINANLGDIVTVVLQKITGKVLTKEDQKNLIEKEVKNIS